MRWAADDASRRTRDALAFIAGGLFLGLAALLTPVPDTPGTVAVTALALLLAVVVQIGHRFALIARDTTTPARLGILEAETRAFGLVTDHPHYPLRPRAPGMA